MKKQELVNILILFLFYFFLNPFISLFLSVILFNVGSIQKWFTLFLFSVSFSLFFQSREIGVRFYEYATDDVIVYVDQFQSMEFKSLYGLFFDFFEMPSGREIGYTILLKFISILTFNNIPLFVFFHYFILFFLFYFIIQKLSLRHSNLIVLGFILLFPIAIYSIAHVWRQQIAVLLFYYGILVYFIDNRKRKGSIIIFSTILFHLASVFYIFIFLLYILYMRYFEISKRSVLFLVLLNIIIGKIVFQMILLILENLGLYKLLLYTEGLSANKDLFFILLPFYILISLFLMYLVKPKKENLFLFYYLLSCLALPIVIPSLNSIYDRFINFSLPLLGLFFAVYISSFKNYFVYIFSAVFIFVIGSLRLFYEYNSSVGIISYIGNKAAFDPTMGILKMLILKII